MPSSQSSSACARGKSPARIAPRSTDAALAVARASSSASDEDQSDSEPESRAGAAGPAAAAASSGSSEGRPGASAGAAGAAAGSVRRPPGSSAFAAAFAAGASSRAGRAVPSSGAPEARATRLRRRVTFSNVVLVSAALSCASPTRRAARRASCPTCFADLRLCSTRSMALARSSSLYTRVRLAGCPATLWMHPATKSPPLTAPPPTARDVRDVIALAFVLSSV